ncbi:MAG: metal ABC transporter permease [Candidatus Babeliales bacterium]
MTTIFFIACLTSVACALPGIFLVLRGIALMSDAISHAILLGIAIMFLVVQRLDSPLLMVGATLAGLLTVACTETIISWRSLKKDAAIGIVFPLFFSLGVILISRYARNVHLDMDMILLGEIAFAPFNRLVVAGYDCGPFALWSLGILVCLNSFFIWLVYKELVCISFDQEFAAVAGFSPLLVYYGLMTMTSITAVVAFDCVGSLVVVALMVTPAATAYMIAKSINEMVQISLLVSVISSFLGCSIAYYYDVSIAGTIATVTGIIFFGTVLGAKRKIFAGCRLTHKEKIQGSTKLVCLYAKDNEFLTYQEYMHAVAATFNWKKCDVKATIEGALKEGFLELKDEHIAVTKKGYDYIQYL